MDFSSPQKHERYLIYPNESIDKLTVNRTFERMFEDIDKKEQNPVLSVSTATEKTYGTVKFSSLTSYQFDDENLNSTEKLSYKNNALTIDLLKDYSSAIEDSVTDSILFSPVSSDSSSVSADLSSMTYWIKMDYIDSNFIFSPNGNLIVNCSFDVGINNIPLTFGTNAVLSGDVISPVAVNGYENYINITKEDFFNFTDYINDNELRESSERFPNIDNVIHLMDFDGKKFKVPFVNDMNATLKHNVCNWTTYSSFKQSYVEIHYSSEISLKELYNSKYNIRKYNLYADSKNVSGEEIKTSSMRHNEQFYTQNPIIMGQVGFYNNESNVKPVFGFDNTLSSCSIGDISSIRSEFEDYNTITQKELSVVTVNGSNISPVNGNVIIKKYSNKYDSDGNITDNVVYFDIVMKFMVGSASDPRMVHGLQNINSKAKVQFAMIGV